MHDVLIRGGKVVDGTGAPPRTADIAIASGKIVEVGRVSSMAKQTIEADGALVTPGFVDVHTHYDGQFLWDDTLDPSFSHGVTTAISGNCGVGFAPASQHHEELIALMEGVDDIPGAVINEGLRWDWRTFPDYLDRLDERAYSMDVAALLPHAPLRVFVMGERAIRHEQATQEDIEAMAQHVRDALAAGAAGFSSGRLLEHLSIHGQHVPGTFASDDEVLALAGAMRASKRGIFQIIPKGALGSSLGSGIDREGRYAEHRRMEAIGRASGRPVTYSIAEFDSDPEDLALMLEESERCTKAGVPIHPQIPARGAGMIHMLDTYHVFLMRPSYREIAHLPVAERARAMREPARRTAILREVDVEGEYASDPRLLAILHMMRDRLADVFVLTSPADFEPGPDRTVGALGQAAGKTPEEFAYDHYAEGDGGNMIVSFFYNYVNLNLDHVYQAMQNTNVLPGLGDGGAHMRMLLDASMPTFELIFWGRERIRGPKVPIELLINRMTGLPAKLYGLADRGTLAVGQKADINVIDFDRLMLKPPHLANDLPSGAPRLLQESRGYLATLVNGTVTRYQDQDTSARPGRLIRFGH